jgi:hypothetical protein
MNELSKTPALLPPSSSPTTPLTSVSSSHSISSSINDYSPNSPKLAERQTLSKNDLVTLSNSLNSINTFSSDEGNINNSNNNHNNNNNNSNNNNYNYNDNDNQLFEIFNGSIKDFASPIKQQTEIEKNIFTQDLKLEKTRNNNELSSLPLPPPSFNIKRNITPVHNSPVELEFESNLKNRITDLESEYEKLSTNYFKIEREILYVEQCIKEIEISNFKDKKLELEKLNFALLKLKERLQSNIKKKYDLSIQLNKLRRNLYGDNKGGNMTQYFARKVSN